jgi:hypothetical protein
VGNISRRRWKKSSLQPAHLVSIGHRDEKWPAWVRFLVLVGASLVLWGVIALAWLFLVR